MDEIIIPEWLVPGADVVVYDDRPAYDDTRNVRFSRVCKVGKKSFSVISADEPRIYIDSMTSSWRSGNRRRALPAGSAEVDKIVAADQRAVLIVHASRVTWQWGRDKTDENLRAALAALQAIVTHDDTHRKGE